MQEIDFLYQVWKEVCSPGDWVFLSTKQPKWKDYPLQFDKNIKGKIRDFLRFHPGDKQDIYFCPLPFRENRRLAKNVKPVNLLWSDVDDGDPSKLKPSVLWESSPGRHHALWFLKEKINAEDAAELNRALTYYLGADKGGWDLSQVLRVPGTRNHKYKSKPTVRLIHMHTKPLDADRISRRVGHKRPEPVSKDQGSSIDLSRYSLPSRVLEVLNSPGEKGKRSDVLWWLENKLADAGVPPQEIVEIIKASDWNKFAGRHDEEHRLNSEVGKVVENRFVSKTRPELDVDEDLESFADVMGTLKSSPGWALPGFWMKRSHGIVAGEPKAFKSTLVMDMALSFATGKPFLGQFPMEEQGTVLYIQNENAHWIMKDRFEKMLKNKGVGGSVKKRGSKLRIRWPKDIPFYMVNQRGFMLSNPEDREYLSDLMTELKPGLLILDPLYLMFDGDVGSAQDLFPILQWLMELKNTHNCSLILVHHYNKSGESKRGGQRMLGSTTLHGWVESAWYLTNMSDGEGEAEIVMEREFRGAGMHNKLDILIKMGEMGDPTYSAEVVDFVSESPGKRANPDTMKNDVLRILETRNGVTEGYIGKNTGYNEKQVREVVDLLIETEACYRKAGRIYLRSKE